MSSYEEDESHFMCRCRQCLGLDPLPRQPRSQVDRRDIALALMIVALVAETFLLILIMIG